jgi:hypothetical protein
MFLDLIMIIKPKVPLLNLFLGLFSTGIILTTYSILPMFPWMSLLMLVLTILVISTGVTSYMKGGEK